MGSTADAGDARQNGRPQVRDAERADRAAREARGDGQAQRLTDLALTVAMVETTGRLESDLAGTLRAMAAQDRGEAAARRLLLAEDAAHGAQLAAQTSARLQQHARWWAEHADVVALRQALDRAATTLTHLALAEERVAGILTDLASRNGSDLAARRGQLAVAASAAAQHARDLAQSLHRLAATGAAKTQPDGTPVADTQRGRALAGSSAAERLADIDRRLGELRLARPAAAGEGPARTVSLDSQRAQEARRHWQESVAHLLQARRSSADALR